MTPVDARTMFGNTIRPWGPNPGGALALRDRLTRDVSGSGTEPFYRWLMEAAVWCLLGPAEQFAGGRSTRIIILSWEMTSYQEEPRSGGLGIRMGLRVEFPDSPPVSGSFPTHPAPTQRVTRRYDIAAMRTPGEPGASLTFDIAENGRSLMILTAREQPRPAGGVSVVNTAAN